LAISGTENLHPLPGQKNAIQGKDTIALVRARNKTLRLREAGDILRPRVRPKSKRAATAFQTAVPHSSWHQKCLFEIGERAASDA